MYRFPRRFRWFRWAVILVGLYAVTGFFVLPPLIRSQLPKRLAAELDRSVSIGRVEVNPFTLSVTLENVNVTERDRRASFLAWKRLYVNFDALPSVLGEWVIGAIELEGFQGNVSVDVNGALNFSDLLAKAEGEPEGRAAPHQAGRPVRIGRLAVTGAQVAFRDESRRQEFATLVGPVTFVVRGFRTSGRADSPYAFEATTEAGERVAWRGTLTTAPFRSEGEFQVQDVLLPKYAPYYSDAVGAVVEDGRVTVKGKYEVNFGGQPRKLALHDATLALRDLRVTEPGATEPMFNLPKVDVTGLAVDALARRVEAAAVTVEGGSVAVRREADGTLNWMHALAAKTASPGAAKPSATGAAGAQPAAPEALDVRAGEIAVADVRVHAGDFTVARPADVTLNALKMHVKNFSFADGVEMPVQVGFDWAPQGAVQIEGTVKLKPNVAANLVAVATNVALEPLSPYVEQAINARIAAGTASTQSRVHVTLGGSAPAVAVDGDASFAQVKLEDRSAKEPLAGFDALTLRNISANAGPQMEVAIDDVTVKAPTARVVVQPDHALNIASLHATRTPEPTAPAVVTLPTAAPAKPSINLPGTTGADEPAASDGSKAGKAAPRVRIARVTISDGDFKFVDQSMQPAVQMALTQFGGTIAGLSSENLAKADVKLSASVNGSGPMSVSGQVNPLGSDKSAALNIDSRNIDLQPLSPYAAKFAGYKIAGGKLRFDVKLRMENDALDSANVITLEHFTWGAPTDSPDATKLPVRLAVALLQDRDGKIVLDVPVKGNVKDPNFDVSRVVGHAVGNLLKKAATSPFALLGAMFGGGGEELAWQEFAPGSSELQANEKPKLATMVKALTDRPGLSVAVEGGYVAAVDRPALQREKLEQQLRAEVQGGHRSAEANSPETAAQLTAEEHATAVRRLYAKAFPNGPLAQAAARPVVEPTRATEPPRPPAEPKKDSGDDAGLVKRTWNLLTLKSWREHRAEKHEEAMQQAAAEQRRREAERNAQQAAQREAQRSSADQANSVIGLPIEQMTEQLVERVAVSEADLKALAQARAQTVRDYFTQAGIAAERVVLAPGGKAEEAKTAPRVALSLR